jgi:hypothetical protein
VEEKKETKLQSKETRRNTKTGGFQIGRQELK